MCRNSLTSRYGVHTHLSIFSILIVRINTNYLMLYLYVVLLYFPTQFIYIDDSDFIFEKSTAVVMLFFAVLSLLRRGWKTSGLLLFFVFMSSMFISALLNIEMITSAQGAFGDALAQILRLFIYAGIARYVYAAFNNNVSANELTRFVKIIIRATIYGQSLILLLQLSPFNSIFNVFYFSKSIIFGYSILKFDGSLGNPNYLGYLLCLIGFSIYYSRELFSRREFYLLILLSVGMILVCGSRTAFIVHVFQLTMFYPMVMIVVGLASLPMLAVIFQVNDKLFELYTALIDSGQVETFEIRRSLVEQSFALIQQRPLFGHGYRLIEITDNFYVSHLMRYGWFGSIVHAGIVFFKIWNISPTTRFMIFFIAPIILFNYTGAFIDNFRLYFFTIIIFFSCAKLSARSKKQFVPSVIRNPLVTPNSSDITKYTTVLT